MQPHDLIAATDWDCERDIACTDELQEDTLGCHLQPAKDLLSHRAHAQS